MDPTGLSVTLDGDGKTVTVGWNDEDSAPPFGLKFTYTAWVSKGDGSWLGVNQTNFSLVQTGFMFTDNSDGTVSVSFRPGTAVCRFCLTLADVVSLSESDIGTDIVKSKIVTVTVP